MSDEVNNLLGVGGNDGTPPIGLGLSGSPSSGDFWAFRTMITPVLIQVIFWIGVIACVVLGIAIIKSAYSRYSDSWNEIQVAVGIAWIVLGPVVVRIYCEFAIVFFRMNETLTEIRNKLK
ncbi:MAG: DUF4282 domain-containing protein [Planctomycetes bacterium]|nr:DUF4282 domain-containing protein [Planctomycetota bacterium]